MQGAKEDDRMYSLVLLDDEKIVLQGIQKVFRLEDYGFQVTGAFNNPLKALESLDQLKPDLIITDVKMPQMDGLEFSARVREKLPDTEIVILSGYDEFSNAQHALKLGVRDYLLKPIKKADFAAMLTRMYKRIEDKAAQTAYYDSLQKYAESNHTELKNRFFLELAEKGTCDEGYIRTFCRQMHLDMEDASMILVKLVINEIRIQGDYMSAVGKITEELKGQLEDFAQTEVFLSDEEIYFLIYGDQEEMEASEEDIRNTAESFEEELLHRQILVYTGISRPVQGLSQLLVARNECDNQILMGSGRDDQNGRGKYDLDSGDIKIPYDDIEALFAAIAMNDAEKMRKSIERIYDQPANVLYRDFSSSLTFLILLRLGRMINRYEPAGDADMHTARMPDMKELRKDYPSASQQKELIGNMAFVLADLIATKEVASPKKIVRDALNYIREHYNENISLTDVSENINISKNYLCDIFKKELNVTFINYVTALRIEKAKELLVSTDMKMYEISAAVGYNDYAYFSQIFKRQTGTTLSAYRRRN